MIVIQHSTGKAREKIRQQKEINGSQIGKEGWKLYFQMPWSYTENPEESQALRENKQILQNFCVAVQETNINCCFYVPTTNTLKR